MDMIKEIKTHSVVNLLISSALVMSTFTQLRFPGLPIGVSDLMFLSYIGYSLCIILFFKKNLRLYTIYQATRITFLPVVIFFLVFVFLMCVGTFLSLVNNHDTGLAPYHNLLAFSYLMTLFLICFIRGDIDIHLTAFYTVIILAVVVSIMVISSLYTRNFFGVDLYYLWTDRLMLFTRSPNHLADFIAPLPFLLLHYFCKCKSIPFKGTLAILIFFVVLAGVMSQSKATLLAWFIAVSFLSFRLISSSVYTRYIVFFLICFLLFSSLIYHNELYSFIHSSLKNMMGSGDTLHLPHGLVYDLYVRSSLFFNAIDSVSFSPFFGNGAGASTGITGPFLGRESHNHIADVLIMTGYVGLLAYLGLMTFLAMQVVRSRNIIFMAIFIIISVVSMFHFQMRQPLFWFYLIFISYEASLATHLNQLWSK